MKEKSIYSLLSKYREEVMGVAMLWVMWSHSALELNIFSSEKLNNVMIFLRGVGYGGVDLFILLSGIGIYNSLSNNSISKYMKNRIKRIVPAWWIVYTFTAIVCATIMGNPFSPTEYIGGMTFTGFLNHKENQESWYISFIMFVYIVAPVIYSFYRDNANKLLTCVVMIFITIVLTVPFWRTAHLMGMSRFTVFVIGMYISADREKTKLNRVRWSAICLTFLIGIIALIRCMEFDSTFKWEYALYWYPFILIAPSLAVVLGAFFSFTDNKAELVNRIIKPVGKASLEIYIVSDWMFYRACDIIKLNISARKNAVLVIMVSILLGLMFHRLIEKVITPFKPKRT